MPLGSLSNQPSASRTALAERFCQTRALTTALIAPLAAEDCVVQSMPDASPAKWHLAHTTWFFEQFVLGPHGPGYREFDARFGYLFNSYYETVGERHRRADRGLLTRPTLEDVCAYRESVDEGVAGLLARGASPEVAAIVELGVHHEQQHQELLLTDIKHLLSCNPLRPAYRNAHPSARVTESSTTGATAEPLIFHSSPEGIYEIGHAGHAFSFDNETPRHRVFLAPFALAHRPICNAEYREFIRDGGYTTPQLWMSDGWATVQSQGWQRPIYWNAALDGEFTFDGERELDDVGPVCHVSWYEADAFARWAGARLPTEAEWEAVAARHPTRGNFLDSGALHPGSNGAGADLAQLYGDVWEWTASSYSPYPGFAPARGAIGEYNGKFMANQFVLRGGSCVTPAAHIRATYRNFFYPTARWQFAGIRLAKGSA
ncbi:MAG TPA: ergothioneine biosynthesis protein EgtB [Steroidobacteraceae bacterium]|nr:ergothioneine biosynthesis protein EgtB [Steroidobacteraceae bacterium]